MSKQNKKLLAEIQNGLKQVDEVSLATVDSKEVCIKSMEAQRHTTTMNAERMVNEVED